MAIGPQIPSEILKQIIPIVMQQLQTISKLAEQLVIDAAMLASDAKCDDPEVQRLKRVLENLNSAINTFLQTISSISKVSPILSGISSAASILKLAQLAIPSAPGVPSGPVSQLIILFDKLGANSKSAATSLNGVITSIQSELTRITGLIESIINKLGNICNGDTFDAPPATIINNGNTGNNNNLIDNNLYQSIFYDPINVSNVDITQRLTAIQDLVDNNQNVLTSLIEAPSNILFGKTNPLSDTGNINDFYINTETNLIFGPKTNEGWDK
jgi:hypothetical protein